MRSRVCLASFLLLTLYPSFATAELVYFTTGRSLSVRSHRTEGETLVLVLRGGGEMICEMSLVARIEPDEVPYPDPPEGVVATADLTPGGVDVRREGGAGSPDAQRRSDPRYDPMIDRIAARHGVDAALVRAVIQVESAFERRARSPKGAMGLMQLMPATARQYAVANPYDAESNIEAGTQHLKALLSRLPLALALAAYNAGEATVERFRAVPPYPETRQYVARVLELAGL